MMNVSLQNKKINLIQWLSTLEDVSIIDKILEIKNKEIKDWYQEISDSEKNSIEKGLEDAKNGKLKPHSEARKIYEKWL